MPSQTLCVEINGVEEKSPTTRSVEDSIPARSVGTS